MLYFEPCTEMKDIYICCHVDPGTGISLCERSLLNSMRIITGSVLGHIVIAKSNPTGEGLLAYEIIMDSEGVKKHVKSLYYYDKVIKVPVAIDQFNKLFEYLDSKIKNKTQFNYVAHWWNFLPFTRWCPTKGFGVFCSQLIADGLAHAGIINLNTKFKTDGYLSCCDCFSWLTFMWGVVGFTYWVAILLGHWLVFGGFWLGIGVLGTITFWGIFLCVLFAFWPIWIPLGFVLISCVDHNSMKRPMWVTTPPKTYQMSVKLLWDLIKDQRNITKELLFNGNVYNEA